MQLYANNLQDTKGNAIAGAQVAVTYTTGGAVAPIYSDNGVTPLANPFLTDAEGEFEFYAAAGTYTITVTSSLLPAPKVLAGVNLFDGDAIAGDIAAGDAAVLADLASTASGEGASLVGTTNSPKFSDVQDGFDYLLPHLKLHASATYGVDDTGVSDATTTLQAAITAAAALGRTLVITGTPRITSTILLSDGCAIEFDGVPGNFTGRKPTSYIIKDAAMTTDAIQVTGQSVLVRGGGVIGQSGNTGDNIAILNHSCRWEHGYSEGAGQDGWRIGEDSTAGPNSNRFVLIACGGCSNGRDGIHVEDGIFPGAYSNANAGELNSPFCQSNGRHGIYGGNSFANTINAPLLQSNVGKGLYLDNKAVAWSVFGGDIEANTSGSTAAGADVYLADTEIACTFTDAGDLVGKVAHGLADDTPIRFWSVATTTGLSTSTVYYVISATADTFQVSTSIGGSAVALTNNGTGIYWLLGSGGIRGLHRIIGTNVGTTVYDGAFQTSRGWVNADGYGAASGDYTINGEKDWTPILVGATTPGTIVQSTSYGKSFKNGRMVTCIFDVVWTSASGMTGTLRVEGLPYSARDAAGGFAPGLVSNVDFPTSRTQITGVPNGKFFDFYGAGDLQTFTAIQSAGLGASGRIGGVITYWTAD